MEKSLPPVGATSASAIAFVTRSMCLVSDLTEVIGSELEILQTDDRSKYAYEDTLNILRGKYD